MGFNAGGVILCQHAVTSYNMDAFKAVFPQTAEVILDKIGIELQTTCPPTRFSTAKAQRTLS